MILKINNSEFIIDKYIYDRLLNDWKFSKSGDKLFISRDNFRIAYHRYILNASNDELVDHKNRNRFDNRLSNLRISDKSKNGMNREVQKNNKIGFKCVSFNKQKKKYRVVVQRKHVGFYSDIQEAISASIFAQSYYQGEFACV